MTKTRWMLLIILVLMTLTSCGLDYRYSLDESLHNQIECVWGEDNPSHITYQGETYRFAGTLSAFRVHIANDQSHKNDTMLSWNGSRYFWYIDLYYSDRTDRPIFIYEERCHMVYFREDYDYLSDVFIVEGTNEEIVLANVLSVQQKSIDFAHSIEVELHSKQNPRIRMYIELGYLNDQWYLSWPHSDDAWIVSDTFVKMLSQNGVI